MKSKSFIIAALLITFSIFQIYCFEVQEILTASNNDSFITRFDVDGMAKKYLVDFNLVRNRAMWNRGREFVYQRYTDRVNAFITVGLHSSTDDAENVVLEYLNGISIGMREGPIRGESIGDKLWWWSPNSDTGEVTNIVFIRKNALLIISSHNYRELKVLAKAIDDDIVKEESYVTFENSILLPRINSISVGKSSMKEGDSVKITIFATDPKNESLAYQSQPGLIKNENEPENIFTFIASRDNVPEPFFGSHTIKFVVINTSNVVSRVSEIKVNVY